MTVLIDTGVLYADHDIDSSRHSLASEAPDAVYDGSFGHPYISDYLFAEVVTLTRMRTGSHTSAMQLSDRLRGKSQFPRVFELIHVKSASFTDAIVVFEQYEDQSLRFTDATSVARIAQHGLDGILRFTADFDGIVNRIDPCNV